MKRISFVITLFSCILLFTNLDLKEYPPASLSGEMPVQEVLKKLGGEEAPHIPDSGVRGMSVDRGREIVLKGRTESPYGGKSERVSRHFVCTSCHNVERDEPDFTKIDPLARLQYVADKGLPFLQGSALYGIVDRRSFYNDDYEKKYGDLVAPARNDLRESIHLCATECAQGRPLEKWEMESIVAYLWTIGLKIGDLEFSREELRQVDMALKGKGDQANARTIIESKYLKGFPANFIDPPADRQMGFSKEGNPDSGKLIYELSCLHCHQQKRYAFFNLDESSLTFDFLDRHLSSYSRYSIYQVVRYGTSPIPWKKAYMPHYTKEKMSEQMLEDLRAYIEQKAK